MPAACCRAHTANDRAVDAAYAYKGDKSDLRRAWCSWLICMVSLQVYCLLLGSTGAQANDLS